MIDSGQSQEWDQSGLFLFGFGLSFSRLVPLVFLLLSSDQILAAALSAS